MKPPLFYLPADTDLTRHSKKQTIRIIKQVQAQALIPVNSPPAAQHQIPVWH